MRTLLITCLSLAAASFLSADSPHPDDTLGREYWSALEQKSKPIFLMGFRLGTGLNTFGTPQISQTLHSTAIPDVVLLLDKFYKDAANSHVLLRDAIHVCLLQQLQRPADEITPVLDEARRPKKN